MITNLPTRNVCVGDWDKPFRIFELVMDFSEEIVTRVGYINHYNMV